VAGNGQSNDAGVITGINVTPLVDITLVLLIIFIVTAKIVVAPAVPVDLPQSSQSEETQVIFSVIVPAAGATLVNGEPAPEDTSLLRLAEQAVDRDKDVRAVISADGAVPHRRIIHTLDLLKRAGISRVAFGAVPVDGEAH
jgi:biopolymer transport protein TolR